MMPFPRSVLALATLASLAAPGLATQARAQANPSADQIMRSLQPRGGLGSGSRGVRPVSPGPSEPSAALPAATQGAPRATARHGPLAMPARAPSETPAGTPSGTPAAAPSVNLTVQFASGSAELTPAAVRTLSELGRALSSASLGSYRFRIEGHTDTVGAPEANKALSEHRAQAVVTFLASRFGIEASRLDAVGMGEDGLLVQTQAGVAEPRNRRVQVINLGA